MYFVDYCHQANVGILMDWVPAHFPCDGHGLGHFDGTALYEHADPRQGMHPDWGTYIFNYGRSEVREFLMSSIASGSKLTTSTEFAWTPSRQCCTSTIRGKPANGFPINTEVAKTSRQSSSSRISTSTCTGPFRASSPLRKIDRLGRVSHPVYTGGLGFSMKWDMGWMNDTLRYLRNEPVPPLVPPE